MAKCVNYFEMLEGGIFKTPDLCENRSRLQLPALFLPVEED